MIPRHSEDVCECMLHFHEGAGRFLVILTPFAFVGKPHRMLKGPFTVSGHRYEAGQLRSCCDILTGHKYRTNQGARDVTSGADDGGVIPQIICIPCRK